MIVDCKTVENSARLERIEDVRCRGTEGLCCSTTGPFPHDSCPQIIQSPAIPICIYNNPATRIINEKKTHLTSPKSVCLIHSDGVCEFGYISGHISLPVLEIISCEITCDSFLAVKTLPHYALRNRTRW